MSEMFSCSEFNHPINTWKASNVENYRNVFNCSKFDQSFLRYESLINKTIKYKIKFFLMACFLIDFIILFFLINKF